ncbi:hypothetical protein [Streptomyces sp. NPDC001851]|uniref:hypothetical protein n=1 Tax=Streptomyces sp. NPDC001851 TaxID=3154529 RepID=UPI00331FE347
MALPMSAAVRIGLTSEMSANWIFDGALTTTRGGRMRKLPKAAAAAAVIASVSFIATGPATAAPARGAVMHRGGGCVDILGEVGVLNGLAGNLLNGEGDPGAQFTDCG